MELEVFEALPADKARAAVASLKKEIDERYAPHVAQLATRGTWPRWKAACCAQ